MLGGDPNSVDHCWPPPSPTHSPDGSALSPWYRPASLGSRQLFVTNEQDDFALHTHPIDFTIAAVDQWGFRMQNVFASSSSSRLPKCKAPVVLGGPAASSSRSSRSTAASRPKRKASPEPLFCEPSQRRRRRRESDASSQCLASASSSSLSPITPDDNAGDAALHSMSACRSSASRSRAAKPPWAPTPRVTIDSQMFPHILHAILAASDRQTLSVFYNTSRGVRAKVRPLLGFHVVMSLRDHCAGRRVTDEGNSDESAPAGRWIDLRAYQCAAPWFSWTAWEEPKPIDVSAVAAKASPHLIEMPGFAGTLAQAEARMSADVRATLADAGVIDLVGLLRLPPRQPTIARPTVLRVHVHDSLQADEYHRVDSPGWDEHTLNRFTPRTLVVLSRVLEYSSTDTRSSDLAVAPSCPVNEGVERLVLRVAYNPTDDRLPRSSIRVPTMYRPGLPKSVKEIVILLVPRVDEQVDPDSDDATDPGTPASLDSPRSLEFPESPSSPESLDSPTLSPRDILNPGHGNALRLVTVPQLSRLGMLDSTADWVAGYLPRGVKTTFVGVDALPPAALYLDTHASADPCAALTDAIRKSIVQQRRLTDQQAIDGAMRSLEVVSLENYSHKVGEKQFALEVEE